MLTMDEPDHTRLRSIVDEAFRRRAILDMEPRIFAIADALGGRAVRRRKPSRSGRALCAKLPLAVICELLGLPRGRPAAVYRLGEHRVTRLDGRGRASCGLLGRPGGR